MSFEADDVHEVLDALTTAGADARICGGWGVDALLGQQTRSHEDLDLWVPIEHDRMLRGCLAALGFVQLRVDSRWNHVLVDERGRQVDVHLVRSEGDGTVVYETAEGESYVMRSEVFTTGTIGERSVACVSPEQQMLDHAGGYEPGETDHADMRALHERLGTPLLPPYRELPATS